MMDRTFDQAARKLETEHDKAVGIIESDLVTRILLYLDQRAKQPLPDTVDTLRNAHELIRWRLDVRQSYPQAYSYQGTSIAFWCIRTGDQNNRLLTTGHTTELDAWQHAADNIFMLQDAEPPCQQ